MSAIVKIQEILGVTPDGIWGPKSQAALHFLIDTYSELKMDTGRKKAQASSFADPADLTAFARCKRDGGYHSNDAWHPGSSDEHCFEVGDNGIGAWRASTVAGSGACVAITAKELIAKWGSKDAGHNKIVRVYYRDKQALFPVKDLLGTAGRVDLNPDACHELGLTPPVMVDVEWEWT